jgi:hypothetical protein
MNLSQIIRKTIRRTTGVILCGLLGLISNATPAYSQSPSEINQMLREYSDDTDRSTLADS